MRHAVFLLLGFSLVGCGGSTMKDGTGGQAGAAGHAGSGASAGSAGAGGASGGTAGTAGFGGSGGIAGAGGSMGGAAGMPGMCCASDLECPQYFDGDEPAPPLSTQCVNGMCVEIPPPGLCWTDQDCGGMPGTCMGGSVCPCMADCVKADTLGKCAGPPPPQPFCCNSSFACGIGAVCAQGVCKPLTPDTCWIDQQCPLGKQCVGASICPCGALCGMIDMPGKCQ